MQLFGKRLAALRREKGLSQAELAKLLNVAQSTIAMYESTRRTPDPVTLKRLADFFNVSVDYLVGRTERRKDPKGEPQQQQDQAALLADERLRYLVTDHRFARLLERIPDLTEEDKDSLAECWEWALQVIEKEKKRLLQPPRKGESLPPDEVNS